MLLFLSCSNENEMQSEDIEEQEEVSDNPDDSEASVEETVYFTYQSSQIQGLENWIIIHDENGNLVDYKQITELDSVDFTLGEDVLPNKLSATKLSYSTDGAGNSLSHSLLTYTDLEIGSVWEDRPNSFEGNLNGNFDLQVNNISDVENVLITTPSGILRAGSSNADEITGNALQLMDIPLYMDQEYLISIRGAEGLTRYLLLMPENDINYEYDYAALQEFDEDFALNLPPNDFNLCFTGGIKTNGSNTYWNYGHRFGEYIGNASGVLNLGYVDGYERYRFGLTITRDDFTYSLQSFGDRVMDIVIPDRPSFMVESADIYDLRFSSELNPVTKNTRHESIIIDEQDRRLSTTWLVFSTGTPSQQIGELPDELSERYPDMDLENLALKAVTLFTNSDEQQQLFEAETSKQRTGNYTGESYAFRGF
jgi:hypothetical protein